jgi:hypothetical protein
MKSSGRPTADGRRLTIDGGQRSSVVHRKESTMSYKFEKLEVWQLALEYTDMLYAIREALPDADLDSEPTSASRAGSAAATKSSG